MIARRIGRCRKYSERIAVMPSTRRLVIALPTARARDQFRGVVRFVEQEIECRQIGCEVAVRLLICKRLPALYENFAVDAFEIFFLQVRECARSGQVLISLERFANGCNEL